MAFPASDFLSFLLSGLLLLREFRAFKEIKGSSEVGTGSGTAISDVFECLLSISLLVPILFELGSMRRKRGSELIYAVPSFFLVPALKINVQNHCFKSSLNLNYILFISSILR